MAKIVISAQIDLPADKREEALKTAQPFIDGALSQDCLLYTSPSPRDRQKSRMPSSA